MRGAREAVPWKAYGRPVSPGVCWQWVLANRLVYKKFREAWAAGAEIDLRRRAARARMGEFFTTVDLLNQGYGPTESRR